MLTRKDLCIATALFVLPHGGCFGRATDADTDAATSLEASWNGTTGSESESAEGDDGPSTWGSAPPAQAATTPSAHVGTLPGSAGVDPSGSATYRIPIEVPPGAAGMQPELALTYRSGGPDGLLGVGWAIEGLGSIERCERTIADDGAASGVQFTESDALCWDGMRLIPIDGASGADGTEYRTRIDRHARIVGHGAIGTEDSWFEAFTKDGRILRFGLGADARIRRDGIPMVWTLDEISDRVGHTISYTYTSQQFQWLAGGIDRIGDVAHRPVRIDYTHFGNTAPERSVRFRYRSVLPRDAWHRGAPTRRAHLVEGIDTFGPDGLVRRHDLRYEDAGVSDRWRLVGAKLCDTHGACLPETTFKWDVGKVGVSDADGSYDGRDYTSTFPDQDPVFRVMLDANGDGATDMALLSDPHPAGEWRVWLGRGRDDAYPNFTEVQTGIIPQPAFVNTAYAAPGMPFRAQAIDFNDDRHGDIIYVSTPDLQAPDSRYGGATLDLLVAYGDTAASLGFERREIDDGSIDTIFHALFPDLDGDGRNDVLMCRGEDPYDSRWVYALNRPTGIGGTLADGYAFDFSGGGVDTGVACSVHDEYIEVDRDGDGDDDVLLNPAYEGGSPIPEDERGGYQALALDTAAATAALVDAGLPRDLLQRWRRCVVLGNGVPESFVGAGPGQDKLGDFNGDGLVDLMRFELAVGDGIDQIGDILDWFTDDDGCPVGWGTAEPAGIRVYWNTGAGFVPGSWAQAYDERGDLTHFRIASVFDYDSDGRADLLLPDPTPPYNEVESWSVLRARDSGFVLVDVGVPGPQLGEYTPNTRLQPVGDHDANGIHDLAVEYNVHTVDLWRNDARFPDLLVEVTDGFGALQVFTYGLTRDPDTHLTTVGCTGSAHDVCASAVRPIVASLSFDNGYLPEDHRVLEYHYTGGASSREGRGFLGYERVRAVERIGDDVVRVVDTEYDDAYDDTLHDHPFARIPWRTFVAERTNVEFDSEAYRFTETIQMHETRASAAADRVYDIVPSLRQVRTWDTDQPCEEMVDLIPVCEEGELLQLWTSFYETTWEHDEFGNVLSAHTRTEDEDDYDATERTYLNDASSWIIGRPLTQVDRSHTASGAMGLRSVEFGYDPETGLLDWVVREPDDPELYLETTVDSRDPHGNPQRITTTDHQGNERSEATVWDAEGVFPTGRENAVGHHEFFDYDRGRGTPLRFIDANGVTQHWSTDGLGRVVGTRRTSSVNGPSDGADVHVTYIPVDDGDNTPTLSVRTQQDGGGDGTVAYDRLGRPVRESWVGFGGAVSYVTNEYDARGRLYRTSLPAFDGDLPAGYERRDYDLANRIRAAVHADDSAVTYSYTSSPGGGGQTVLSFDEEARPTQYELDSRTRLVRTTDALGGQTCFDHGPFGVTSHVRRDCGAPTPPAAIVLTHDGLGRRRTLDQPGLGLRTFGYNAWGELTSELRSSGAAISWARDALGRVTGRTDADGLATWTWDTTKLGLLGSTSSPGGVSRGFTYDGFSRLWTRTTTVGAESFTFTIDYDAHSRLSTITHPPSFGVSPQTTHFYDVSGRLDRITEGAVTLWDVATVDAAGRIRKEDFANAATTSGKRFDELRGRITGIRTSGAGGGILQLLGYEWSAAGDLEQRRDARPAIDHIEDLDYDELHRLTTVDISSAGAVKHVDVEYDALGNITSKSDVGPYVYSGERLTAAGLVAFGYDGEGRVQTRGTTTVAWNASDRPRSIGAVDFLYDADRQRIRRTSTDATGGQLLTIDDRYTRQTIAGQATHRYQVLAEGRVVAHLERKLVGGVATTTRTYLHDDHLGSTDTISGPGGSLVGRMSFDAWGRARNPDKWASDATAGPVAGIDVGFTGHTARTDGALLHMRARMYDPYVGRFISPDPLVSSPADLQSWNRYSYVRNRPLSWTDPSGRKPEVVWGSDGWETTTGQVVEVIATRSPDEGSDTDGGTTGGDSTSGDEGVTRDENGGMNSAWDFDGVPDAAGESGPTGPAGPSPANDIVSEFFRGAVMGDAGEGGTAYTAGHVIVSTIPYVSLGADARDIAVSGADFVFGDGDWVPLAIAVLGVVPFGDLVRFGRLGDDAIALGDDAIEHGGEAIIKGDAAGKELVDGDELPTQQALEAALEYLESGYNQVVPGMYKSSDGTRVVRMMDTDLSKTGNHSPGGPHLNFERGRTVQKPNGRESFQSSENRHIFLPEER